MHIGDDHLEKFSHFAHFNWNDKLLHTQCDICCAATNECIRASLDWANTTNFLRQ